MSHKALPKPDTSDLTRNCADAIVERYRDTGQEVEVRHFDGGVVVTIHPTTAAGPGWSDQ